MSRHNLIKFNILFMNEEFLNSTTMLVISDSDTENVSIDDELEAVYYENSKLFSQIENEYLESIKGVDSSDAQIQPSTTNTCTQSPTASMHTQPSTIPDNISLSIPNNTVGTSEIKDQVVNEISDDRFIELFSTSSVDYEEEKENGEVALQNNNLSYNNYGIGGGSQDFITSTPINRCIQNEYALLERYWYSDEDLPPLENVHTLDKLKNTPSLVYMYDFFNAKISL